VSLRGTPALRHRPTRPDLLFASPIHLKLSRRAGPRVPCDGGDRRGMSGVAGLLAAALPAERAGSIRCRKYDSTSSEGLAFPLTSLSPHSCPRILSLRTSHTPTTLYRTVAVVYQQACAGTISDSAGLSGDVDGTRICVGIGRGSDSQRGFRAGGAYEGGARRRRGLFRGAWTAGRGSVCRQVGARAGPLAIWE
jgi:hypothetical protein